MSGIISPTCSAMKRSFLKPSSRKETAAPAGPPLVRSTTPQVRRTLRRGKASRCVPWRFFRSHAQPFILTKKACVGKRRPFVILRYCLQEQLRVLVKRLVFLRYPNLSLGALPFLRSLAAYRGVDPGCHIFPPFLLPILIPLGNRTTK